MIRFDLPLVFLVPYLFAVGAVIGSFLNVCIYRLPRSERLREQLRGLWSPPSHCPRCGRRILRKDNVPVIGWVLLRGRCRFCRLRISPRYPLIEAANGLLFLLVFFAEVPTRWNATMADSSLYSPMGPHGDSFSTLFSPTMVVFWRWAYHMVLLESLLVASFIDIDLRIIPDGATLPAMAVGIAGSFLGCVYIVPAWFQDAGLFDALAAISGGPFRALVPGRTVPLWITEHPHLHGLAVSLAGMAVGGGSIWMVRVIGQWVLKREAMGFGDVILMATIGAFLGWQPTLIVFFLAPVCALAVVAVLWIFRREREIPYGPYLSLATLTLLIFWKQIWPPAERVFSLGLFVPAMGLVLCALLYVSLQTMQWAKRLLGIPDFEPEPELEETWQSADQLFHFARDNAEQQHPGWRRPQWPGLTAGRGSLFEDRWRNSGSSKHE